jgi:hypothetical protein
MSTNIIKINRGDSFSFEINIPTKESYNKPYFLTDSDIVYFAVLNPHQCFEEALLLRGYTKEDQNQETGDILIELSPAITRTFETGIYYYTVKLQRGGTLDNVDDLDEPDEVITVIERTKFIVNE